MSYIPEILVTFNFSCFYKGNVKSIDKTLPMVPRVDEVVIFAYDEMELYEGGKFEEYDEDGEESRLFFEVTKVSYYLEKKGCPTIEVQLSLI